MKFSLSTAILLVLSSHQAATAEEPMDRDLDGPVTAERRQSGDPVEAGMAEWTTANRFAQPARAGESRTDYLNRLADSREHMIRAAFQLNDGSPIQDYINTYHPVRSDRLPLLLVASGLPNGEWASEQLSEYNPAEQAAGREMLYKILSHL